MVTCVHVRVHVWQRDKDKERDLQPVCFLKRQSSPGDYLHSSANDSAGSHLPVKAQSPFSPVHCGHILTQGTPTHTKLNTHIGHFHISLCRTMTPADAAASEGLTKCFYSCLHWIPSLHISTVTANACVCVRVQVYAAVLGKLLRPLTYIFGVFGKM